MSFHCDYCSKGYQRGHRVSHAKNRTLRRFKPNLHWRRVVERGASIRRLLCTRCLRKAEKPEQKKDSTKIQGKAGPSIQPLAFATP
jgi:large subunit ribosomal protein L28